MTEVASRADFSKIRYAQCWEDADILLDGLSIQPGDTCLGIASAGDNCLAMLAKDPARVIAVDLNPSQLACLELRVAAYRRLDHAALLRLIGSRPGSDRRDLYNLCRSDLSAEARGFWDAHRSDIDRGVGSLGKFENYFRLFRTRALPWVHSRPVIEELLRGGPLSIRQAFYEEKWDTFRWRLLFRIFCSRFVMGWKGRDPAFFRYVQGSVADRILSRAEFALTQLDPADNPYLQWILCGEHRTALPFALRPENFELIRSRLDRIEWRLAPIEEVVSSLGERSIDRFNLSDIFEYMSEDAYAALLERLIRSGKPGGRLLYWNMLVPRRRPSVFADRLLELDELGEDLLKRDKAFFYSAVVVEELK